jgi:broad specificity phosphatase PhoE
MTTVVHLLRHGEVDNPKGILYGRLPGYRLSPLGRRMAATVAEWFADRDVTRLVSSPLERAQETAAPLAETLKLPVDIDDRLIEADNRFEGTPFAPGDGALRNPRVWWWLRNPFRPSWGEPYIEIARRMTAALHAAAEAAPGHETVCVSHQLPIWTLRQYIEGRRLWHDPRRRQCALASVTSFYLDGGQVTRVEYAEPAAHLLRLSPDGGTSKGA